MTTPEALLVSQAPCDFLFEGGHLICFLRLRPTSLFSALVDTFIIGVVCTSSSTVAVANWYYYYCLFYYCYYY